MPSRITIWLSSVFLSPSAPDESEQRDRQRTNLGRCGRRVLRCQDSRDGIVAGGVHVISGRKKGLRREGLLLLRVGQMNEDENELQLCGE